MACNGLRVEDAGLLAESQLVVISNGSWLIGRWRNSLSDHRRCCQLLVKEAPEKFFPCRIAQDGRMRTLFTVAHSTTADDGAPSAGNEKSAVRSVVEDAQILLENDPGASRNRMPDADMGGRLSNVTFTISWAHSRADSRASGGTGRRARPDGRGRADESAPAATLCLKPIFVRNGLIESLNFRAYGAAITRKAAAKIRLPSRRRPNTCAAWPIRRRPTAARVHRRGGWRKI